MASFSAIPSQLRLRLVCFLVAIVSTNLWATSLLPGQSIGVLTPSVPLGNADRNEEYFSQAEISPEGDLVAGVTSGSYSHSQLCVWTFGDRREVFNRNFENDSPVAVWAVRSRKPKNLLAVMQVFPSKDDQPERQVIEVIDLPAGNVIRTVELPERSYDKFLALSEDGNFVAIGNDREKSTVRVFETATGKLSASIPLHFRALRSMTFIPSKPLLAMAGLLFSGDDRPTVLVHDIKANQPYSSSRWQKGEILCIAASSDGLQIASQDTDKTIKLLGIVEGALKVLGTINNESRYRSVNLRYTNNDAQLWYSDEYGFSLWDADTRETIHDQGLACSDGKVDVSPDSRFLILTSSYNQRVPMLLDTAAMLRFMKPARTTKIFDDADSNEIEKITMSSDNKSLVLIRDTDGLSVMDLNQQRQTAWLPFYVSGSSIIRDSVVVDSDLECYYQTASESMLYRRTLPESQPVPILRLPERKDVRAAVATSSGKFVAIQIPDKTIVLNSANSIIHQGNYPGTLAAISDDGKWLATQDSYTVTIVDVDAKSVLGSWQAKFAAAWSFDGVWLIGRGGEEASLWKLNRETGEIREDFPLHRSNSNRVGQLRAIAVAAKSPYMAAAGQQLIRVYNHQSNRMLGVLRGHQNEVLSVAITADGHTVYSGDEDGNLLTWDLTDWIAEDAKVGDTHGEVLSAKPQQASVWTSEPKTFESDSGVRITIEPGEPTSQAAILDALRNVLRQIQNENR